MIIIASRWGILVGLAAVLSSGHGAERITTLQAQHLPLSLLTKAQRIHPPKGNRHRAIMPLLISSPVINNNNDDVDCVFRIPRGGGDGSAVFEAAASALPVGGAAETLKRSNNIVLAALQGLKSSLTNGPKADSLVLLGTTAFNTPICQKIGLSPILGFLTLGMLLGPHGLNIIQNVHATEMLAEIGIVFFLFEMGIHLSLKTLLRMRTTVFGLGGSQFALTALAVGIVAILCGFTPSAAIILGGGLALSSSAFVLQLLKDKNQLGTVYGESSFGVLLLQDLMVVPLLVVIPILAGNGVGLGRAILSALVQLTIALTVIGVVGMFLVTPAYNMIASASSQEALVGLIMLNVLGMSFLTEGLGLSNTLGPFLAGVLLAENKHVHDIEREASPIRGILVGLFFFTVGFEIDIHLILSNLLLVTGLVGGLIVLKAIVASALGQAFGLNIPTARRLGLVLSQGGEFAFVAFRMARSFGILNDKTTQIMLTVVSLTMACTPTLENWGESFMTKTVLPTTPPDLPPPAGMITQNHQADIVASEPMEAISTASPPNAAAIPEQTTKKEQ